MKEVTWFCIRGGVRSGVGRGQIAPGFAAERTAGGCGEDEQVVSPADGCHDAVLLPADPGSGLVAARDAEGIFQGVWLPGGAAEPEHLPGVSDVRAVRGNARSAPRLPEVELLLVSWSCAWLHSSGEEFSHHFLVEGKAILITGCDKGFGFALAEHLHAKGFSVFAACLLKDKNGEGAQMLEKKKCERLKVLQMNICSDEEVLQAEEFVRKHLRDPEKGLWGMVNNAGISTFGEVEFTSMAHYKEVADVNLWGTIQVTKAFLPLIRRAKGRVVNVTSMFGRIGISGQSAYCISNYGMEAFSDCLRYEQQRWGVSVSIIEAGNCIAATDILTRDRIENIAHRLWNETDEVVQEDYGKGYIDRQTMAMKSFCTSSSKDMSSVINAITDALTSKYPYTRYEPMDAYWWIRLHIMTYLPTPVADWLYRN